MGDVTVDALAGVAILELLRRSCDRLGQTVVMVTHDPRSA
jgi:ABC-type lipoprotein export system ATPase subunit